MAAKKVYLSLGSNIGQREKSLSTALKELDQQEVQVLSRSSTYETEAQDVLGQPPFLNLVVECKTRLFPLQLLRRLQKIENDLGRLRGQDVLRGGPRVIDIDILLFGRVVVDMPELIIPHPRMTERRFVLEPLAEIAPELTNPQTKQLFIRSLVRVSGQKVEKWDTTH